MYYPQHSTSWSGGLFLLAKLVVWFCVTTEQHWKPYSVHTSEWKGIGFYAKPTVWMQK